MAYLVHMRDGVPVIEIGVSPGVKVTLTPSAALDLAKSLVEALVEADVNSYSEPLVPHGHVGTSTHPATGLVTVICMICGYSAIPNSDAVGGYQHALKTFRTAHMVNPVVHPSALVGGRPPRARCRACGEQMAVHDWFYRHTTRVSHAVIPEVPTDAT